MLHLGVMVEHRNVVNQLYHFQKTFNITNKHTVLTVTTLTFDPCICEIFWPLAFGARVAIASSAVQRRGDRMLQLLDRVQPDVLQATPTMFGILHSFGWEGNKQQTHGLSLSYLPYVCVTLPFSLFCLSLSRCAHSQSHTLTYTHYHLYLLL